MIKSRRSIRTEQVAGMGEITDAYKIMDGISRRRWKDNIIINLKEIGWKGVDWIRGTSAGLGEYGNEPTGSIKDEECIYHLCFSRTLAQRSQ
jgi:hypothetical protein